jgi:methionine-rich copper-binding protein CopC
MNGLIAGTRPQPRRRVFLRWAGMILALALVLSATAPVQAHAMLMRSIPDANAALSAAPAQVDLYFSEAIANQLSKIKVLDTTGKRVDQGQTQVDSADPGHLRVSLKPLTDGVATAR